MSLEKRCLLDLACKFNCFYLSGLASECKPFVVEGFQVGLIRPNVLKELVKYPEVFLVSNGCVKLNPDYGDLYGSLLLKGKWDNMVSGGLSVGHGILETAIKEGMEEASIPPNILKNLISAGCISFYFESERGLFPNTEFVFDLELPLDFLPVNADGEVETFELLPAQKCLEKAFSSDFKTTSVPVILDFLIRHGIITAENEPDFVKVVELIHVPLQSIYKQYRKNAIVTENHVSTVLNIPM